MAFTTLDIIRKHLVAANLPSQRIENVRVTLSGTTEIALPHFSLETDSGVVKRVASDKATLETAVVLSDEDEISLSNKQLIRGSVAVASDLALSSIFSEEFDFRVNHEAGLISRMASGAIPNSFPVSVWYGYYDVFEPATDYVLDHDEGTLRRTAGSAIPDGASVLVDYTVAQGAAEDLLIEQAIIEADDIVVRALREGYNSSSTDQGLKTGTAYLTLSIVARGMAALMLTRNTGGDAYSRAREWQQLSDKWFAAAWNVLAPFVVPHSLRSTLIE
ncbi:hypothetical protein HUU59_10260 [bacterium]|nr:hypothetical protein [bacterium]